MKFLRQFTIIAAVSLLGEVLKACLPLPVPASVWGLVLMLGALCSGLLKVEQIREAAEFLIEIMPVMFIPAGVGLLNAWDALRPFCIPVIAITIVTTILVMGVTGKTTQGIIRREKHRKK